MGILNLNSVREAAAIAKKDLTVEWRSKHGILTTALFAVMSVFTIGLACSTTKLSLDAQSGLLWVAMLFSGLMGLSRGFVIEEEQGTAAGLRLAASPKAIFWGKLCFHLTLQSFLTIVIVPFFMLIMGLSPHRWDLFLGSIILGGLCLTTAITMCGALVAQAESKGALLAALAFPILIPQVSLCVSGTSAALAGGVSSGFAISSLGGLLAYLMAMIIISPIIFEYVWKE